MDFDKSYSGEKASVPQKSGISRAAMQRMPGYLRYLKEKSKDGKEYISSVAIAEYMKLSAICVKKDLSFATSSSGKPKVGFNIKDLINDLEKLLGFDNITDAILVGAGQLGKTLLSYTGFSNYGLNIVAAFDKSPVLINTKINGKSVYDLDEMESFVKRNNIYLGVITVPGQFAQDVCDHMVKAGIKAIWNFAPANLVVPSSIALKNEDMAASLAVLSNKLKEIMKNDKKGNKRNDE